MPLQPEQSTGPLQQGGQSAERTKTFFQKVFGWMFAGLVVSGATAYWVALDENLYSFILFNSFVFYSLLIGEVLLVIFLTGLVKKMSANTAIFAFLFYCFVSGLTLSVIFLVYEMSSIGMIFFITAGMFGAMSLYGYYTGKDLTTMGQILLMALFGLIIAMLANFFFNNSMLDYVISFIAVIIFTCLTAYDVQKLKAISVTAESEGSQGTKRSIIGALDLYLDFVNLFLHLLRLFGRRK